MSQEKTNETIELLKKTVSDLSSEITTLRNEFNELKNNIETAQALEPKVEPSTSQTKRIEWATNQLKVQKQELITLDKIMKKQDNSARLDINGMRISLACFQQYVAKTEQENVRNHIIIFGVEEQPDENVMTVVQEVLRVIGIHLSVLDVEDALRVGVGYCERTSSFGKTRPIVVKLLRRATKIEIMKAMRDFRRNMKAIGQKVQVTVWERLSYENRILFFLARKRAKTYNYRYVFTKNGKIYVSKGENEAVFRILTRTDLDKYIGPESPEFTTNQPTDQ